VELLKTSTEKRTAVMYGAGKIGRGFIGQVFHDSGFEVVFIDIDKDVISAINKRNSYTQLIIDGESVQRREITAVRAVDGRNKDAVAREIADCCIMAVSVGAVVLPHIAPFLAHGLALRMKSLNILVCENLVHAPDVLKGLVAKHIDDHANLDHVGFVGATIGRMVPVVSNEERASDPALIAVESFCTLPIDVDAVVTDMPLLQHTILCSPFAFEEGKKLYIHNMGHALSAYFGFLHGFEFVWQAMEDESIYRQVRCAMSATVEALARKYNEDRTCLTAYMDDLLSRFGNKGLGDRIDRVGGDPMRKLAPGDRLMGAIDLCKEQGIDYSPILPGIAAALRFDATNDPSVSMMRERVNEQGIVGFLMEFCGLLKEDAMQCNV